MDESEQIRSELLETTKNNISVNAFYLIMIEIEKRKLRIEWKRVIIIIGSK